MILLARAIPEPDEAEDATAEDIKKIPQVVIAPPPAPGEDKGAISNCLRVALGCLVFGCRKVFERIERPEFQGPPPIEGYAPLHNVLREGFTQGTLFLMAGRLPYLRLRKWQP